MRIVFLIIVLFHGLIHLPGFVKGFGLKEVGELKIPITKQQGIVWLISAILLLIFGVLYLFNDKYVWLVGIVAVLISQTLIILFWKDARFGSIPNIIILLVSIASFGNYNFQKMVQNENNHLLSQYRTFENRIISDKDIHSLPEPVKNWLRNSGIVGKPFITLGKVKQKAEMKIKPEQENWMSAIAIQYTSIDDPAFIWTVDVKMNSLINFQGRDKFENGEGEMLIKMNSLINIVNEQGEKLNEGSLQRFLGEMVWFPSLALSPYVSWEEINDTTAKANMAYKGTVGSGTFSFNTSGNVTKYSALRYKGNDDDAIRYAWTMNITGYKTFEGINVPAIMTSTWKLEDGEWTWLKLEVTDIKYNKNAKH